MQRHGVRWWRALRRRVESWGMPTVHVTPSVVVARAVGDVETGQLLTLHGRPLGVAMGPPDENGHIEVRVCGSGMEDAS